MFAHLQKTSCQSPRVHRSSIKTLVAFHYFIASYIPLKVNDWNLKITQLKRKIIFPKLPFLGFMLIFQGAAYNVLFINIILIWHCHYTLSITRFSYIFSLKPKSQGQPIAEDIRKPGHAETPNQLGGTQARKFTKKKPPCLCWVYEAAEVFSSLFFLCLFFSENNHILRWWAKGVQSPRYHSI